MTEAEWLACTDPRRMIQRLRARAVPRKLQLFLCACFRQVGFASQDCSAQAVETTEAFVEGAVCEVALDAAWKRASLPSCLEPQRMARDIARMSRWLVPLVAWRVRRMRGAAADDEMSPQCFLLRDIFGNPFRPITLNAAWLSWNDSIVVKVAKGIYDQRAFDRLPILADALEEAGCDDHAILDHCRQSGVHVRGRAIASYFLEKPVRIWSSTASSQPARKRLPRRLSFTVVSFCKIDSASRRSMPRFSGL